MDKINTVCIIDDDPIYIFATKKIMNLHRFCNSILIFNNGKEALDGLQGIMQQQVQIPDVILLDLNMPVMDGWQFLDEFIKKEPPKKITIYIVSSSINPEDITRAKAYSSVKNYIIKPITEHILQQILADVGKK